LFNWASATSKAYRRGKLVEKAIGSQLSLDEAQLNYSPIEGREAGTFRKTKEDRANEKAKHFASLLVCLL